MSKIALQEKEGKDGLFRKWSWNNWVSTWKEGRQEGKERGRKAYTLAHMGWETCTRMFVAALFIIS